MIHEHPSPLLHALAVDHHVGVDGHVDGILISAIYCLWG